MPESALTRLFTYVANTLIQSAQVNAEHDQFIARLNKVTRTLHVNTTSVGNVGAGLDTLHSYSLPAGTLANNGDRLRAVYSGFFGANDTNKRVNAQFNGQSYESGGTVDIDSGNWRLQVDIIRLTATTVRINDLIVYGSLSVDSLNTVSTFGVGALTICRSSNLTVANLDSNAITMLVQGEGAADNDVVQDMSIIEFTGI